MADERTPDDDFTDAEVAPPPAAVPADPQTNGEAPLTPVSPVAVLEVEAPTVDGPTRPPARALPPEASASVRAEQARLQAEREARRAAREAALRPPAPRPDPVALARAAEEERVADPTPVVQERVVTRRNTDSFLPSLSLFVLRLTVAAILGIRGVGVVLDLQTTTDLIGTTILPAPSILAIVLGVAEILIAVALLFGVLTRVAGLGVVIIGVSALSFVLWGPWSPFVAGQPGFTGELEVLLSAVGFVFVALGGGAWGLDHGFRMRRAANRYDD